MIHRFKIGRAFGVDVFLHWTYFLGPAYIVYLHWKLGFSWPIIGILLVILTALTACVLLHEFGHAMAAKYFGVEIRDIILTPIGGAARLIGMSNDPLQEFAIAAAGPAVNLLIALVFAIYIAISGASLSLSADASGVVGFPQAMVWLNGFLFLFNLIPAFPMDGGRIFRSMLAVSFKHETATLIAGVAGQFVSIGFLTYGIYSGELSFVIVGAFVFLAASSEIVFRKS